jgi:hypothetical protein
LLIKLCQEARQIDIHPTAGPLDRHDAGNRAAKLRTAQHAEAVGEEGGEQLGIPPEHSPTRLSAETMPPTSDDARGVASALRSRERPAMISNR